MRFRLIPIVFAIILMAISARLFYWQIIKGPELARAAASQRDSVLQIPAERGSIYSSDGSLLAGNQPGFLLFASPIDMISDPHQDSLLLAPIIYTAQKEDRNILTLNKDQTLPEITEQGIQNQIEISLKQKKTSYVPLAHRVIQKYIDQIVALKIPGLGFDPEPRRFYPEGAMAATSLGFVANGGDNTPKGFYGLEGYYDGELSGQSGLEKLERDASGAPIPIGSFDLQPPSDGRSIKSTIDRFVQFIVEQKLREGLQKYGAKQASAVVLDPKTGNIIASATFPSFDPLGFSLFDKNLYVDGIASDTYEPGSTFKGVTMAIGLDTGTITPTIICPVCDKAYHVADHDIETWNNQYFPPGSENMTTVLEHSDNVGAAWVSERVGKNTFYKYTQAFGIGSKTNVDIEGEQAGVFYDSSTHIAPIDLATMSFGQGFSLTALKMAQMYGAFANKGVMMQPRFVSQIIDKSGNINLSAKSLGQIIKPETASTLTTMLQAAVENGEARRIIPHGYRIAGKTGTAQVPIAGHYDPKKTVASFVGYGPVENPKFVLLVKYTEPTSSPFAALTAEPTFFDIVKELYPYFGLAPTP
jgi:stage V sporulation protein D (sporulation-specific penicillin-binding protein)